MPLINPSDGGSIRGLNVPHDLYWVLKKPAPLAGMRFPEGNWPWAAIRQAGFTRVVSLHRGEYDPTPLFAPCPVELEDLAHGGPPVDANAEIEKIRKAVSAIVHALRSEIGVVVHCKGGRGRTGTVLGCVLRELGFAADEIVGFLKQVHEARGKPGWPESCWQSRLVQDWGSLGC